MDLSIGRRLLIVGNVLSRYQGILSLIFTVIISSSAYYCSLGENNIWILLWIAPLPLCMHALRTSYFSSIAAGMATTVISGFTIVLLSPLPVAVVKFLLIEILLQAVVYSIILGIYRCIALRYKHWSSSLVFASGITSWEFIVSRFSRGGSISSIAYSQMTNLPITQIASITGIWAITFLLSIVPVGIALAWHHRQDRRLSKQCLLFPVSLLLLTVALGAYRLSIPVQDPTIKIGIAAEQITLKQYVSVASNKDLQKISELIQRYTEDIAELAQSGAKVILLPEKILTLSDQYDLLRHFGDTAKRNNVYLIVGINSSDGGNFYNSAFVFSPNGEVLQKYNKQHLLPPLENEFTPGNSLGIIDTDSLGRWGIEICKDMDFVHPALEYSQKGINVLLVPALDFHYDAWTHGRVAIMRGVEGNYAVARAGQWGLLTLSDCYGRIVEMKSTDASNEKTLLLGELALGSGKSIYSQLGDWFGWFCIVTFTIYLLLCFQKNNKSRKCQQGSRWLCK